MKTIRTLSFVAAVAFLSACGGGESHDHSEEMAATYHCPMDCEDGKTYSEEGTCPVCGMDLVVVE